MAVGWTVFLKTGYLEQVCGFGRIVPVLWGTRFLVGRVASEAVEEVCYGGIMRNKGKSEGIGTLWCQQQQWLESGITEEDKVALEEVGLFFAGTTVVGSKFQIKACLDECSLQKVVQSWNCPKVEFRSSIGLYTCTHHGKKWTHSEEKRELFLGIYTVKVRKKIKHQNAAPPFRLIAERCCCSSRGSPQKRRRWCSKRPDTAPAGARDDNFYLFIFHTVHQHSTAGEESRQRWTRGKIVLKKINKNTLLQHETRARKRLEVKLRTVWRPPPKSGCRNSSPQSRKKC